MGEAAQTRTPEIQLFRDVFNASPIGIAVENLEGQPLFVNPAFCSFLGFSEEELRKKHCVDFSPAEDAEKDWALFQQLKAGSIDHYQLEKRYFRRDGSLVWGSLIISLLKGHSFPLVLALVEDITDKKKAEEARLRHVAVIESSDDAIAAGTLDGTIVGWNAGAQKIYGYTEGEAVGKPIAMLVPPELLDEENKIIETLRAGGRIEHFETVRITKMGKKINVSLSIWPIKDSSGRTVGISGTARDITERKLAEETLRNSEERFRLAAQAGRMYSFEWDVTTDRVVRSSEHVEVLGVKEPLHITHQQFMDKVHPDDRPQLIAAIAGLSPENPTCNVSYRVLVPDGAVVWIRSNGRAFFDSEGRMLRLVGMVADVTDQKLTEESLRTSEERLRLAQKVAGIGTFERNIGTGVNTWTAEMESLHGLPPGGFGGTREAFENLVHPDDRAKVIELVEMALKTGQSTSGEWRVVWPDGSVHWISGRWQVLMDEYGEPSRVIGVDMDITERKLAEEALLEINRTLEAQGSLLRSREELLRVFVKNVPAAVAMLDRDMRYLQVSDRWCTDYLPGRAEILGRSHYELFPDMPERWREVHSRALQGETLRADEDRWEGQDGPHWARWEVRPWKTAEGDVGGILILAEDISRRKQMEESLSDLSRKLIESQEQERARIGRELHDDINQRLSLLSLELEQLLENPSEIQPRVKELRRQMAEVSNDVQALSHDLHSSKLEYLGVVAGIRSWCKEFAERQKMEIDFRSDVSGVLPLTVGLSLFRVIQEALNNAIKHSGVKRVEIELLEDSGGIHLVISDLGRGFDVEAASQGKGLGLTSMRERVRLINGTIAIDSKPMGGTTIHVRVPLGSEKFSERAVG